MNTRQVQALLLPWDQVPRGAVEGMIKFKLDSKKYPKSKNVVHFRGMSVK